MQRAGVASLLCSVRRDLAAFRRVPMLEDTPTPAVHEPPVKAESVSHRPAADMPPPCFTFCPCGGRLTQGYFAIFGACPGTTFV